MLERYLLGFDMLTEEEVSEGLALFKIKKLKKGEHFVEAEKASNYIGIVKSGILRAYFLESFKEITYCFRFALDPVASYAAYINKTKSEKSIQAITDCEVWVISREDLEWLQSNHPNWTNILKSIVESTFTSLESQRMELLGKSPHERYQLILESYPDYLKNIPLNYIASYIGITPRHLTRIRSF